jgi:ABC-type transporter Mla maintaining outer membrane lipid asymmetry permease subunit MlaE
MARILLLTVACAWLLSGLRFLAEWIGIPVLPSLFDPIALFACAAVAGAWMGLDAGRFVVTRQRQVVLLVAYAVLSRVMLAVLGFVAQGSFPDRGLGLRSGSAMAILGWQTLWAVVSFLLAALASLLAQRTVKEISERPTGQM